jgi:formylglycine-generating enzyme required for sulfatase activity/nitrate/TMAO reductase-like tetraheme cytochrome c subunit
MEKNKDKKKVWKRMFGVACIAGAAGMLVMVAANWAWVNSSKDDSCMACHVHPDSEASWRMSVHYAGATGTKTSCADCHLPPSGTPEYVIAKAKMGTKDIMSYVFKNHEKIDWAAKGELEHARKIVYKESCMECHHQLFPEGISDDGVTAHLYWEENNEKFDMHCIDCHLDAGHYNPDYTHAKMTGVPKQAAPTEIFTEPTAVTEFADYVERIPGTGVSFSMRAIPAGSFTMGSPANEPLREANESQREETVERFFMAETEVTWAMYWAFLSETMSEGRIPPEEIRARNTAFAAGEVDALSGPTPPFGNPEQGWGGDSRPAITMTYYSAEIFCQWLSARTGKKYRLPTEAEWEYAARGGTTTPYFFEGSPKRFSSRGLWNQIFGADTTVINTYAVYEKNSGGRTATPDKVKPNPWGLRNMVGNVWEYTSDFYSGDGVAPDTEHVVRGGTYADDAAMVRSAVRAPTQHDRWLRTDPQQPKSIWWYSDIKAIGFRVVCEFGNDN